MDNFAFFVQNKKENVLFSSAEKKNDLRSAITCKNKQ